MKKFTEVDLAGNGFISRDELLAFMTNERKMRDEVCTIERSMCTVLLIFKFRVSKGI